jgi:alpha-mannosidase
MSDGAVARMFGDARIDPVWLRLRPEGLEATRATVRPAPDRMKETPGFVFSGGLSAIYDRIEKTDPAMFEEIRAAVAQGRWAVANGWRMQPDCNIPSGESYVRHALYGPRFSRRSGEPPDRLQRRFFRA